jgi:hypothetical protein
MNMILTSTTGGLDAKAIEPFFNSLRLSGCQDPVMVSASKISDQSRELLAKYQATVVDFDYRGMPVVASLADRLPWAWKMVSRYYRHHRLNEKDFRYLVINCSRFFCYHQYLSGLQQKPKFVFQADIRDIVFQKNPFSFPFHPGLSVATECRAIIKSKCAIKHLCETVGPLEMWRIARREIINCGTIMADFETTMQYLELLISHFNRAFFWALFEGIDQALHTYFVHKNLLNPICIYNNWNGPFLTMDNVTVTSERKNSEGYLCNDDGSVIPIVHQYDRIKGLYQKGEAVPPCWEFYKSTAL